MTIELIPRSNRYRKEGGIRTLDSSNAIVSMFVDLIGVASTVSIGTSTISNSGMGLAHGDTVTLVPADFGLSSGAFGSTPNMRLFDSVDNISAYSSLNNGDVIPVGTSYPWKANGSVTGTVDHVKYSTAAGTARHQFDTARYHVDSGSSNAGYLENPTNMAYGHSYTNGIFLSWWVKVDGPINMGASSKKLRLWGDADGDVRQSSWTSAKFELWPNGGPSCTPDAQIWHDWGDGDTVWLKTSMWLDTRNSSECVGRAYENDAIFEQTETSQTTITYDGSSITETVTVREIGYTPSGSGPSYNSYDMTDIYIAEYAKRIELSDNATWGSHTDIPETQPVISWTSDQIQISLFQGALSSLNGKYLHFIDADGSAVASVALEDL